MLSPITLNCWNYNNYRSMLVGGFLGTHAQEAIFSLRLVGGCLARSDRLTRELEKQKAERLARLFLDFFHCMYKFGTNLPRITAKYDVPWTNGLTRSSPR